MAGTAAHWILANRYSWIDRPGLDQLVDESYEGVHPVIDEAVLSLFEDMGILAERYDMVVDRVQIVGDHSVVTYYSDVPFSDITAWVVDQLYDTTEEIYEVFGVRFDVEASSPAPGYLMTVFEISAEPGELERAALKAMDRLGIEPRAGEAPLGEPRGRFGSAAPWTYAHRYAWSSGVPHNE